MIRQVTFGFLISMMSSCVNSYTTRGTSKEWPRGKREGNMWCKQWLSTLLHANNLLSTSDNKSSKLYCLSVNFHLYAFRNDASIRSFSAWLTYPPQPDKAYNILFKTIASYTTPIHLSDRPCHASSSDWLTQQIQSLITYRHSRRSTCSQKDNLESIKTPNNLRYSRRSTL